MNTRVTSFEQIFLTQPLTSPIVIILQGVKNEIIIQKSKAELMIVFITTEFEHQSCSRGKVRAKKAKKSKRNPHYIVGNLMLP